MATRRRKPSTPKGSSKSKPGAPAKSTRNTPTRFAHPFYTTTPLATRATGPHGKQLLTHIQGNLNPVPKPRGNASMALADIIGQASSAAIEHTKELKFHAVGDTGRHADSPQGLVAAAMTKDYTISQPEKCPAFFLHLGDVIYGPNKIQRYRPEFYEPYVHYPGKIIAIPGNHDGEIFPKTDPRTLEGFQANFCASRAVVPPIAGTIFRETMTQPGVYWFLDAPFVQVIGLYSNAAENPGFISGGAAGTDQRDWLVATLKSITAARKKGPRKALVIASHHPPFTSGGHSPSTGMLADIDTACAQGGVLPDMFLSGHAHSYQRYTRFVPQGQRTLEIPYIVAGTGGISDQAIAAANNQRTGDHTFVKSRKGYGYLLITAEAGRLTAAFTAVDDVTGKSTPYDRVVVDLAKGTVS
jgi:hypothetical protein